MKLTTKQKNGISFILWVCQNTEDNECEFERRERHVISVRDISVLNGVLWLRLSNGKKFSICPKKGICSVTDL